MKPQGIMLTQLAYGRRVREVLRRRGQRKDFEHKKQEASAIYTGSPQALSSSQAYFIWPAHSFIKT